MTENKWRLILDFNANKISQGELLEHLHATKDGTTLSLDILREAEKAKDDESIEFGLILGFIFGFDDRHLAMLHRLAFEDWHYKHEDVVSALDGLNSPVSIDTLYFATQWVPDYLEFDEARALAVKAIWALGNIGTEEAVEKLVEISKSKIDVVRENAQHQLERLAKAK